MASVDLNQVLALPAHEIGAALLSVPEDQWLDRKSARVGARQLADAIAGFANAEGGVLVIGLSDGAIEGVDGQPQAARNAWRQAAIDFLDPPVRATIDIVACVNASGAADHLFVIAIEPSERVHANRRDEVHLRVGDETRKLTSGQRQELLYEKGQASFEVKPVTDCRIDDLDHELLGQYAQAVQHPEPVRLLEARGLLSRKQELTVAGVLLFADHPQRYFPEAFVRVLRFRGTERGTGSRQQLVEDIRCEGPIPRVLDRARAVISEVAPVRRALGADGRFVQIGIVPRDAWLEGVVNAVIHRSYSISGDHVRVEVFDDRIEIESPGRFPGLVDLSDLSSVSRFARNPRIARVCADLYFGQELGEGIRRIFEEMRLAGLVNPVYMQTAGTVRLRLSSEAVDVELERRLPPGARAIVSILRAIGSASTGELVSETGVSRPLLLTRLRALEEAGVVEWIGKSKRDPRAFWRIRVE